VRSDDLGATWREPVLLQDNGLGQDREWIVRDPASGALYVVWQNVPAGSGLEDRSVEVAWSLDGGATWRNQEAGQRTPCYRAGMPVVLQGALRFACVHAADDGREVVQLHALDAARGEAALVADAIAEGQWPSLTLLADGTLAMLYDNCFPDSCALDSLLLRSRDGGATWSPGGSAMGLAEGAWDRARVYWSEADPFGGQHLLVRFDRDEALLPADPSGSAPTPMATELRHVVLDASGAPIHSATLAAWRSDEAPSPRAAVGFGDDVLGVEGRQQHPRCGGSSCYYSLAWSGDRALLAFTRDGAIELALAAAR
jgi:hypothetical protein